MGWVGGWVGGGLLPSYPLRPGSSTAITSTLLPRSQPRKMEELPPAQARQIMLVLLWGEKVGGWKRWVGGWVEEVGGWDGPVFGLWLGLTIDKPPLGLGQGHGRQCIGLGRRRRRSWCCCRWVGGLGAASSSSATALAA